MSIADKILLFERTYDEIQRKMPLYEGKQFKDEDVYIDFSKYNKCTFTKCTIILKYGITSLINCNFDGCGFISPMGSPASAIIQIERMIRDAAGKKVKGELEKFR